MGECIRGSGLMDIGSGSSGTVSAKNTYVIECFGSIEINDGVKITGEIDAIRAIRNQGGEENG